MGFIYLIRNTLNGKGYVGQTTDTAQGRFKEHIAAAKHGSNLALHKAIRKYGIEHFSLFEIASCDTSLLNDLEKHYIKFYGTFSPKGHGYNLTLGGDGAFGYIMSDESKAKMSLAKKGRSMSEADKQVRRGKIPWNKGMKKPKPVKAVKQRPPISDETRAKMSEAKRGKAPWNKGKESPLKGSKRPPFSEEWKAKISASCSGKKLSDFQKEILRKANIGRICSTRTRQKISEANRGRHRGEPWSEARRQAQERRQGGYSLLC